MRRITPRVLVAAAALTAAVLCQGGLAGASASAATVKSTLQANPGFETVTAGTPACWNLAGGGAKSAVLASGDPRTGKAAGKVTGKPADKAADSSALELVSGRDAACRTPMTKGRLTAIGVWYQSTAPVRLVGDALLSSGSWTRFAVSAPFSATSTWTRAEFITPATPTGTVAVSIGVATTADVRLAVDDATLYDAGVPNPQAGRALFTAVMPGSGLISNEYAFYNPGHADAVKSPTWEMTSGSLFASGGAGWTGKVDGKRPDAASAKATDSAVFRLRTTDQSFRDVQVGLQVKIVKQTSTTRTPVSDWDGVHIWLRYQNLHHLYAVSVARRDGAVVIKKKCSGTDGGDDSYYSLSKETLGYPITPGAWRPVAAAARTNPDGSVTLTLSVNGTAVASATDAGTGCAPITAAGAMGLRGDNSEFLFSGMSATGL
jgi:hypothetical protein